MTVKLSSSLPKDVRNGLLPIETDLIADPGKVVAFVGLMSTSKITVDTETGDSTPTVVIRSVEPFPAGSADSRELQRLVRRAMEARLGKTLLPLELEREIEAFGVDPQVAESPDD